MNRSAASPRDSQQDGSPSTQSIPLQDLARQQDQHDAQPQGGGDHRSSLADRNLPVISTYWDGFQNQQHQHPHHNDAEPSPNSPIDAAALQFALPPDITPPSAAFPQPTPSAPHPYSYHTPYYDETAHVDYFESDSSPLTSAAQPISGALATPQEEAQPRDSFQTVSDIDNSRPRERSAQMLGFDLETGFGPGKHRSYGDSLAPTDNRSSRAPSTAGALYRAGSIVRAMSQRVVNISNEGNPDSFEQQQRRQRSRSRSPSADGRVSPSHLSTQIGVDTSYPSLVYPSSTEKKGDAEFTYAETALPARRVGPMPNPLKGRSLGVFGPDNVIRRRLCDVLVHPFTEPFLLLLIVLQAVLLAVEAANNVYLPGNERPPFWDSSSGINWALLSLFIIFSLETVARIIVSGFILNAAEYSTIDRKKGIRAVISDRYDAVFRPQRQKSVKAPQKPAFGPSTFARSFTMMHGSVPETIEEQQRMQLARRAFLRHGFNRLDFIAVVSFWIAFVLSVTGLEMKYHIFVFRMLSCLRIVRLLALTNGTAIILRSLKKAAPLLVRVSFLIGFFWLLFAIIGVQSFKSSLSRSCVWRDPSQPDNFSATYRNEMQFCGGYLNENGQEMPWVRSSFPNSLLDLSNGSSSAKGYICPRNSICLEQSSPYNGTVSFDNIISSLELVFVIMSANTWSDLMYYTTYSDFLPAALFFGAGIMIMMLWLTNLLIAVITSSFQVIREESKASAFTADKDFQIPGTQEEGSQRVSLLQKLYNATWIFWVLIIAYELSCQAWRSSEMSVKRARFININSVVVTILLDIEIAIRFAANWKAFHRNARNMFDLFLAVANTIIILPPIFNSGQVYAWLTLFQILRSYRVVLAIPITGKLIVLVLGNASGIVNLIAFVFLITFIVAILAVQLFRGELPLVDDSGELVKISFYNVFNSFLGMYQILSSEGWTSILYDVTSYTEIWKTSWYGAIFLISWFIMSYFILVNMFIAVIQENFDVSEDEKRLEQVKAFLQRKELGSNASSNITLSDIFSFGRSKRRDPLDYGPATMEMLLKDAVVREFLDDTMEQLNQDAVDGSSPRDDALRGDVRPGFFSSVWSRIRGLFTSREPNPFYSNIRFDGPNDTLDARQMARQAVSATAERRKAQREYLARHPTYNNSLYIFTPKNPIRRLCQRLVGPGRGNERFEGVEPNKIAWYAFTVFIYAAIIAMVILACITTPLYQKEYLEAHNAENRYTSWFVWVDLGFAILFTVEAAIKIIADGWFFTPNAYYRSSWGIIDGVVLITLWINVITLLASDGTVSRVIGAFKALRALRLLNISNSARDTFHSLIIVAGWKIISAALVSLSLLIPFAIYAVNLFHGQFLQCNDGDLTSLVDCFGEYESSPSNPDWPLLAPRVASNPYFNFDDFASSLFILFQIVSQEGWTDVSFAAQAITGRGSQPEDMAAQGNAMFFVVFNLLATVFVLTLFISVFMRNYTEQTGVAFLTAEQRSWLELRKLLRQISPSRSSYDDSENKWKKWCHKRAIEKRGRWYTGITAVLVLHLILLMLEYYPEPVEWSMTRDIIFLLFTLIYVANVTIRIVGLGWKRFRRSTWDVFSLVSVCGALVTSVAIITMQQNQTLAQLHKYFLVSIVLLLIPRNDALDQLFKTAAASLTTIINLLATWLVFFLMFAVALTQTFSLTRFGESENVNINFRTVPNALLLLFRMSVGEGWNQIMEDYANIEPPLCVEDPDFFNSDCGSTNWARFLFIAWNLVSMYIFVNLFISLIYESFSYVYQRSSGMAHIDRDEIRRFKEAWRSVDPNGSGYISKDAFPRLLGELSGVFEMRIYDSEDSIRQILEDIRNDETPTRHASTASASGLGGVNIRRLNDRLAQIDVRKVRERRRRFNIFYEEVMVSADPVQGISFTMVLMIMAHYNIISDSKSLRLEEFLRRRARLQRVEEEVRRRVVVGFFDTVYWSRQFKRHLEKKRSARMTAIPQLDVPDIFVDDEDDRQRAAQQRTTMAAPPAITTSSDLLAVADAARPQHRSWSSSADISTYDSSNRHPLSLPRATPSMPGHHSRNSALSFELQESGPPSGENSRRGSSVSPAQVRELLDDSVWVESIRRSATIRRSVRRPGPR
ncbi:Ion transport protein-domain-containing protein [Durotheca rogersii]|uniref:Ion transport protein-domain-containing protein n=1 Tax=Durotheca rogersii TaxID=419775 RepID=UPI00221F62D2|nr:Ion transport protein-domain-containing protein [Durotheca rogersii]KAI5862713.1 Ion transport protein-domain-containing protein [Durotheca rogersii]